MRRREFMTLLGGAAWPLAVRAAKALGLEVPSHLQQRADELIE